MTKNEQQFRTAEKMVKADGGKYLAAGMMSDDTLVVLWEQDDEWRTGTFKRYGKKIKNIDIHSDLETARMAFDKRIKNAVI